MRLHNLTAVTGGIGSGKSVVCRILECMGFVVYDCDRRAKQLMDASDEVKCMIARDIAAAAIDDGGNIDRAKLAEIVFADREKLLMLNRAVHSIVIADLAEWYEQQSGISFVETAILYQSGLDRVVGEIWEVTAPIDVRIRRVMERNSISADQVRARIEAQRADEDASECATEHRVIVNDGERALLPQIWRLILEK